MIHVARRSAHHALLCLAFVVSAMPVRADQPVAPPKTVLTISGILAWATGGDDVNPLDPSQIASGSPGVNFRLSHRLGSRWTIDLVYDTDLVDNTAGRTFAPAGTAKYSLRNRDWATEEQASYTLSRNVSFIAGDYYHARRCCPAAGSPSNPLPAVEQGVFLESDYVSPALTTWGLRATASVHANAAHHVPPVAYLAKLGYADRKRTEFGVHQGLGVLVPVARTPSVAFVSFSWGALDYYNNAPFPFYYTSFDYGVKASIARDASLEVVNDLRTQRPQSYPNAYPQAIHRPVIDVIANYDIGIR